MTNQSGSLCPAAKAADIIGDKWVLLIMRELLMGATRYNQIQRAQPRMSPTVLSKRLKQLEADGLIVHKAGPGDRLKEYRLTKSGRELAPVINHMSKWGLRWARRRIAEEDMDVGAFMWDFHRTIKTDELCDGETVFGVIFPDQPSRGKWWVIVTPDTVDLCTDDPGRSVDLYITGKLPDLASVWMGDETISGMLKNDRVMMTGSAHLKNTASVWFPLSRYADVRPQQIRD